MPFSSTVMLLNIKVVPKSYIRHKSKQEPSSVANINNTNIYNKHIKYILTWNV